MKCLSVLAMLYLAHLAIGCAPTVSSESEPSFMYGPSPEKDAFLANRDSIARALWRDGLGENTSMPSIAWEQPDPGCEGGRIASRDPALGCVYGVYNPKADSMRVSLADPWQLAHEMTHASLGRHGGSYTAHGPEFDAVHFPAADKLWSLAKEMVR